MTEPLHGSMRKCDDRRDAATCSYKNLISLGRAPWQFLHAYLETNHAEVFRLVMGLGKLFNF